MYICMYIYIYTYKRKKGHKNIHIHDAMKASSLRVRYLYQAKTYLLYTSRLNFLLKPPKKHLRFFVHSSIRRSQIETRCPTSYGTLPGD